MYLLSAVKNKDIYKSSQRREEALWRVPVGDIEPTEMQGAQRATPSFAEECRHFLARCEFFEQYKVMTYAEFQDQVVEEIPGWGMRYQSRMDEMKNKRPFLSRKGYMGMGPLLMRPGDVVVVLLGARVPYVLRSKGERNFFTLGEAYCDGVMDGEILTGGTKESFFLV
jgi:hypothetical protein